ncbi:MAG: LysR family transcriptional regulator [Peptococcaceae bacterium]|jgi:DNA-binding transcriptional LysR family regulator|nr:LysR family transcriptional regulator [Peptococcaceae bacterium]
MNSQQLKSLITTAERGSFSQAGEALYLSKPAVKKQIDSLEKELGFTLFVRTHQGISLTPAGELFCNAARKSIAEMEAAAQRGRELALQNQTVRIITPSHPHLLLDNVFNEFSRKFPGVKIKLQASGNLVEDILHDRADVAECTYHPMLDRPDIRYTVLFPMPYKCLFLPNHPLAKKQTIRLEDLSGQHVGVLWKNTDLLEQLNKCCDHLKLETLPSNDLQSIMGICYNNGVFITKASFVNMLNSLAAVPLETDLMPVGVILHRKSPSPVVMALLNVVYDMYPQENA